MSVVHKKEPKFWFTVDGHRYGARFATIAENATCGAEVERLTNGQFTKWLHDEHMTGVAQLTWAAVFLNALVVVWPTGVDKFDFTATDDTDLVMRYWEAYRKASDDFRLPGSTP